MIGKKYRRRRGLDTYAIIFDVTHDDGKPGPQQTYYAKAYTAADAAVMFDFFARGEERQWGCKINGREILLQIATFPEDDDE